MDLHSSSHSKNSEEEKDEINSKFFESPIPKETSEEDKLMKFEYEEKDFHHSPSKPIKEDSINEKQLFDYKLEIKNNELEILNLSSRVISLMKEVEEYRTENEDLKNHLDKINEQNEYATLLNDARKQMLILNQENQKFALENVDLSYQIKNLEAKMKNLEAFNELYQASAAEFKKLNEGYLQMISEKNKIINKLNYCQDVLSLFKSDIQTFLDECNHEEVDLKNHLKEDNFLSFINILLEERKHFFHQAKTNGQLKAELTSTKKENQDRILELETEIEKYKNLNEQLDKRNFELQQEIVETNLFTQEMRKKEKMIEEIIIRHKNLNLDLKRKDKFVAEVLLLAFFYDKVCCLYRDRFNMIPENNALSEINLEEISNLLEYYEIKEDVQKLITSSNIQYKELTDLLCDLFPKTRQYSESSVQNSVALIENFCQNTLETKEFQSQIENESINFNNLQKLNEELKEELEKNRISFEEKCSKKLKIIKKYIQEIFGWELFLSQKFLKIVHIKSEFELYFKIENDRLELVNEEEILANFCGVKEGFPEIVAQFNLLLK